MAERSLIERLLEPFPQHALQTKSVPGQRPLTYVAGHTVIRRLINDAEQWDWQIKSFEARPYGETAGKNGNPGNARLLLIVTGTLSITSLGSRDGMGVQVVTAETGGEDMWKGAQTDALKNAARLFGVGIDLYGPDYEAGEVQSIPAPAQQRQPARNPATVPADFEPQQFRDNVVAESNRRYEERAPSWNAIYGPARTKGLLPVQVQALACKRYGLAKHSDMSADDMIDLAQYIEQTDADTLKQEAGA